MVSGPVTGPTGMISSTSWPMRISVRSSSSADTSHPGAPAWNDVAQPAVRKPHQAPTPNGSEKRTSPSTMSRMSGHAVAELQGSLEPMPNANPGVDLEVDSAGAQRIRIDHAAAAPLDPAAGRLFVGEPDVDLGRRLGEREEVRAEPGAALRAELERGRTRRACRAGGPWSGRLSTASPSTWWNTGVWVASSSSVRKVRPIEMM